MLDDHSRAVAGYTVFLDDPTAEQTALALHQAAGRKTNPAWPVMASTSVHWTLLAARLADTPDEVDRVREQTLILLPYTTGDDAWYLVPRAPARPARSSP